MRPGRALAATLVLLVSLAPSAAADHDPAACVHADPGAVPRGVALAQQWSAWGGALAAWAADVGGNAPFPGRPPDAQTLDYATNETAPYMDVWGPPTCAAEAVFEATDPYRPDVPDLTEPIDDLYQDVVCPALEGVWTCGT